MADRVDEQHAAHISATVFERLLDLTGTTNIGMRSWDGEYIGSGSADAVIRLQHPGALRALLLPPGDLVAGEAYIYDDVDIEGDVIAAIEFGARLQALQSSRLEALRLLRRLRSLPAQSRRAGQVRPRGRGRLHSRERDRQAVTAHYNTGNEFFQTFLDPLLVYSCAAFLDPTEPLEVAQRRKLDLICRKLELRPGRRMLDIGCGWGALAIHAAEQYGVEVLGITLSAPQAEWATMRAKEALVEDRVRFEVLDYRDVRGRFDAISSVGMVEHVGERKLAGYFRQVADLLEPGGAFLNHGIVRRDRVKRRTTPTFVNTYVFPDGELLTVDRVIGRAADAGFEIRDVESLRTSYAITLRNWVENLEANRASAVAFADEITYRIWRLYMAGSAVAFESGGLGLFQLLLHRPDRPWTYGRAHLLAVDDR